MKFENLETAIVRELESRHLIISCAESFTGGMIASRLINVPGASNVLKESLITYCDEAKMNRLFVNPETIAAHSAVSRECVEEMAEGIIRATGCDVGVASTGYAGSNANADSIASAAPVDIADFNANADSVANAAPDGEKDGHIFLAVSFRGQTNVLEMHLNYDRNTVRKIATEHALKLVSKMLEDF